MPSDGYNTDNPGSGCSENTAACRIGVGFGNYIPAHVATVNGQTQVVAASATKHELFDVRFRRQPWTHFHL
eukprot:SAG31_NODE_1410_length_8470_cov_6.064031_3_plen_71_part_00